MVISEDKDEDVPSQVSRDEYESDDQCMLELTRMSVENIANQADLYKTVQAQSSLILAQNRAIKQLTSKVNEMYTQYGCSGQRDSGNDKKGEDRLMQHQLVHV